MKRGYLRRLFSCVLTLCMLITSFAGIVTVSADSGSTENVDPFENSVFENYITRRGSILYDGSEPFRTSVGLAAGNLFCPEDGGYHFADEFEMRDMFETMIQLGQNSTRTGWFSFRPKDGKNHQSVATQELEWMVEGPGQFNEEGFRAMDKMLQLANEYGIRLFIPISPNPEVMSSYRNLTADQFYNNLQLIEDTKAIFNYTLNRTNYYTGVKYKDDPAILAWQIGNELDRSGCTTKWTNLMSEYIKSIDQNHLVAAPQTHYWKDVVSDPNIDIVDTHIYDAMQFKEMIASDIEAIKGQKALVLGELGMQTGEFFADLLPWISEQPEVFGAYLFMMGSHNSLGGIYCHSSYSDYPNIFWPGYDEEPDNGLGGTGTEGLWNTQLLFKTIRELNYGKMGIPVPEIPKPKAPHLLPIENADDIWWRGSVGARYYDVERAENENGPWTVVGENIQDYKQPRNKTLTSKDGTLFGALFADKTIQENKTYYYRVKAKTPDGVESDYSNVRKLGDTTLDEILQKEADEKADAKTQPQIKAEIPTVSGELEPFVPNVIKRVNLPTEIKVQLSNAVVLKIGESNAFVNNGVEKIDPEREQLTAYTKNDRTLVPVRFISEAFGCNVAWNDATQTVAIFSGLNSSSMRVGENVITVKDQGYELDQPAELLDDARVFAPLRAVCELSLGKTVLYRDGIIVIYDGKSIANPEDEAFWSALEKAFNDPFDPNYLPDQSQAEGTCFLDGGFESGRLVPNWTGITPNNYVTGEEAHSGDFSLKLDGNGGWTGPRTVPLSVEPGKEYLLSFYVKAPKAIQNSERIAMTYKFVHETSADVLYTTDYRIGYCDDWAQIIIPLSSKSTGARFGLSVNVGTAYIDDMVFVERDSETGKTLLASYEAQSADAYESSAVIIDEFEDTSKIYELDNAKWKLIPENITDGTPAIEKSSKDSAYLVYKVDGVKAIKLEIAHKGEHGIKLYYSADGKEWKDKKIHTFTSGTKGDYTISTVINSGEIDPNCNFVKVELPDGEGDTTIIERAEVY